MARGRKISASGGASESEVPARRPASKTPAGRTVSALPARLWSCTADALALAIDFWPNVILALHVAVWAQLVVFGTGAPAEVGVEAGAGDVLGMVENCAVLFFICLWLSFHPKAKWVLPAAAALLVPATPLRVMTGEALLTAQNADTFFGTDWREALGFMTSIPWSDFQFPLCVFAVVLIITRYYADSFTALAYIVGRGEEAPDCGRLRTDFGKEEKRIDARTLQRRWGWCALAVSPLIFITSPMGYILYGLNAGFDDPPTWKPVVNSIASAAYSASVNTNTVRPARPDSPLETGASNLPVRNYVLVMGETLRADALSLYGFRAQTSPYLDSIPTKRVSRMVSVSMATNSAVPHFLALSNEKGEAEPANNVLMLAREAGFATYWISAQGKQKAVELPISRIARDADEALYVERHSDFALVPALERLLDAEKNPRDRFIVLHAYGSHEDPCARIEDMGKLFAFGREEVLDCYATTALKADELLKRVARVFELRGETYSIVFTSDHALSMWREEDGNLRWKRQADMDTQYVVPFVQFGTRVRTSSVLEEERSILDFPRWFPSWIGIETNLAAINQVPVRDIFAPARDGNAGGNEEVAKGDEEASPARSPHSPVRILTLSGKFRNFSDLRKGPGLNDLAGLRGPKAGTKVSEGSI